MTLYNISDEFRMIMAESEEAEDSSDYIDALEMVAEAFDQKAVNVAKYIAEVNAEVAAMKEAEQKIAERRKAKQNKIERLKKYLLDNMDAMNKSKIEDAEIKISTRSNAESLVIDHPEEIIKSLDDDFLKVKYEIDKTRLKDAVRSGDISIDGVRLERTRSVVIK